MYDVGYSLEAIHTSTSTPIVSLELDAELAGKIIDRLWPDHDFWAAPGGSSIGIGSQKEANVVNEALQKCFVTLSPKLHIWNLHVYAK